MNIVTFVPQVMLSIFLASLFLIVLVAVLKILKELPAYGTKTTWVLALCISILCIVGMCQLLDITSVSDGRHGLPDRSHAILTYILLPYIALSLAVILSQILQLTSRMLPGRRPDTNNKGTKQPAMEVKPQVTANKKTPEKTNQRGRPKKEELTERDTKDTAKPVDSVS